MLVETVIAFVAMLPSPRFPRAEPALATSPRLAVFTQQAATAAAVAKSVLALVAALPSPRLVLAVAALARSLRLDAR